MPVWFQVSLVPIKQIYTILYFQTDLKVGKHEVKHGVVVVVVDVEDVDDVVVVPDKLEDRILD